MAAPIAGILRSRGVREAPPAAQAAPGVYASAADLASLEAAARDFSLLPRQPVHSLLSGRHASRVRGRGLAFEELRQYVPGDDLRTMDWKVTARTGKPFVRVYTEEKDRPVLVVVDQRINMFFGSRRAMKSVTAAEVAALGAWRALAQGDRVGGVVFDDTAIAAVRPHRSRESVMRILERVAERNAALRAESPAKRAPAMLDDALEAAARLAKHDGLVLVASDFDGHGPRTRDLLLRMAVHNDVVAVVVYDPFLTKLPPSGELVVSDGELQVVLDTRDGRAQKDVADFADARAKTLLAWQREIGVPVLPISTAEETAPQLRKLLGDLAHAGR